MEIGSKVNFVMLFKDSQGPSDRRLRKICQIVLIVGLSSLAYGNEDHFNRPRCGLRVWGLGGAYTAVSDDSSAVCYNPAGMVFAKTTKETSSFSSYAIHHYKAKDAVADGNVSHNSAGVRGFFGGMTKDPIVLPKIPVGFAIYVPDAGERHQSIDIISPELGISDAKYRTTEVELERRLALALALPADSYAMGAAVTIINRTKKGTSVSSGVVTGTQILDDDPSKTYLFVVGQNFEYDLWLSKIAIGWMWYPTASTSLGATIQHTIQLTQDMHSQNELTYSTITEKSADGGYIAKDAKTLTSGSSYGREIKRGSIEARLGLGHRITADRLMAIDVQYTIPGYGENDQANGFRPVWDVSTGAEFSLNQHFLMGLGVFTSMDGRKNNFKDNQVVGESIDQFGGTFKTILKDEESEYFFGFSVIRGLGRGTPVTTSDKAPIRNIETTDFEIGVGLSSLL